MAWVIGGKKFGQYTYEHWFDNIEIEDLKKEDAPEQEAAENSEPEKKEDNV